MPVTFIKTIWIYEGSIYIILEGQYIWICKYTVQLFMQIHTNTNEKPTDTHSLTYSLTLTHTLNTDEITVSTMHSTGLTFDFALYTYDFRPVFGMQSPNPVFPEG